MRPRLEGFLALTDDKDGHPEKVAKQAVAEASTGRFTHPQEVAELVLPLASGRAGNVTGTDVLIDGGLVKPLDHRRGPPRSPDNRAVAAARAR